jgi:hypothetical protein
LSSSKMSTHNLILSLQWFLRTRGGERNANISNSLLLFFQLSLSGWERVERNEEKRWKNEKISKAWGVGLYIGKLSLHPL